MKNVLATAALVSLSFGAMAQDDNAHMFSADLHPEMKMHTFSLDQRDNENDSLIQLVAEKDVTADCNVRFLNVSVEEKTLEGWGYPYFVITEQPVMGTTMLPCDEEEKTLRSRRDSLYRYNSKVPLVIYAPADLDIDYRVWSAEK
uniref:ecotin family protein n=1 Tax=Thaumasiovibrio occultus TaxID=1891184 RepID=UPI000B34E1D9|nr:ecotin family protein [Thaumasiovibrio occultus]